jgi:two-component system phosphate regulon response regulator PhoB/two-component system alkaline phosphatase synthesis response regulator PhoP
MKTILLADDDRLLIQVYSNKLKSAGYEVESAQSGEEIVRKLQEKKFDLVLLDIVLPEISGWEVLEKIKEQKSKIKNLEELKIVIVSNLGQRSEVEKGLKLGAVKYLVKSHYTPSQILEEVKQVLPL